MKCLRSAPAQVAGNLASCQILQSFRGGSASKTRLHWGHTCSWSGSAIYFIDYSFLCLLPLIEAQVCETRVVQQQHNKPKQNKRKKQLKRKWKRKRKLKWNKNNFWLQAKLLWLLIKVDAEVVRRVLSFILLSVATNGINKYSIRVGGESERRGREGQTQLT